MSRRRQASEPRSRDGLWAALRSNSRQFWQQLPAALLLLSTQGRAATQLELPTDLPSLLNIEQQREPAPRLPRRAFMTDATITLVSLSPDGNQIAYLQQSGERRSIWVMSLNGENARALLTHSDATQIYWSSDSQWLFAPSPSRLLALAASGVEGSGLMATLRPQDRTEIFGVDPGHPAAMLLIERPLATGSSEPAAHQLWRVDRHGERTLLYQDTRPLVDFAFDTDGHLAYLRRFDGEYFSIRALNADGNDHEVARCTHMRRCRLISTDPDGALWLLGNLDSDRTGLQRITAEGEISIVHEDPLAQADLRDISLDPASHQPLIAHYRSSTTHSHALESRLAPLIEQLTKRFGEAELHLSLGAGINPAVLIGVSSSRAQRTRWYSMTSLDDQLRPLFSQLLDANWPVAEAAASAKIPVNWQASDGLRLYGFVSVPPGIEAARAPLVVKVHGGPWSATGPEYSETTQFLVNRGYAVFEPNFRGSTGFGRNYLLAAKGDFGNGRVQADVVEGTRWLLKQGIGDAQRVAIIGASFGGYSALLGATFEPELFHLAIAAVPPTDFAWTLRWAVEHRVLELEATVPFEQTLRGLDLDLHDQTQMSLIQQQSPLTQGERLSRPIILFAAGQDQRVAVRSITHYGARLVELGKDVDLYIENDAGHALDSKAAREAWLYLLEHSLHRELGGEPAEPPSTEVSSYLDQNRKIDRGKLASRSGGAG